MAMLRDWNKKEVDLFSPVAVAILDPTSSMNLRLDGAQAPRVSAATGCTMKLWVRSSYFVSLAVSALSAALPGSFDVK